MIATPSEPESLAALHDQGARHLRLLLIDMAEHGAILAKLYVQQAQDQAYGATPGKGPSPDCATAYNGVSRSVRRSVLLIQKLTAPAPAPKAVPAGVDKVTARKEIIRRVEDTIYRDAPEAEAAGLHAELLERLETAEFDDELDQRPVTAIVHDICADLGLLGPDSISLWKRRTPADIAVLYARAAAANRARGTSQFAPAALMAALLQDAPPIRGP